eukprot:5659063-Amphidinium_carterae.1
MFGVLHDQFGTVERHMMPTGVHRKARGAGSLLVCFIKVDPTLLLLFTHWSVQQAGPLSKD